MQGNILYRFPSLQRTAQKSKRKEYVGRKWADWVGGVEKFFKEKNWQFRFFTVFFQTYLYLSLSGYWTITWVNVLSVKLPHQREHWSLAWVALISLELLFLEPCWSMLFAWYFVWNFSCCFISLSSLLFFIDPKRNCSCTW